MAIIAAALALWVALAALRLLSERNKHVFDVFYHCGATKFQSKFVFFCEAFALFGAGAAIGACVEYAIVEGIVAYSSMMPPLGSLALAAPLATLGFALVAAAVGRKRGAA